MKTRATQQKMAVLMKMTVQESWRHLVEVAATSPGADDFDEASYDYEASAGRFRGYVQLLLEGNAKVGLAPAIPGGKLEALLKKVERDWLAFETAAGAMRTLKRAQPTPTRRGAGAAAQAAPTDARLTAMIRDVAAASDSVLASIDEILVRVDVMMNESQQEVLAIERKARLALRVAIAVAIVLALALGLIATDLMVIRPVMTLKAVAGRIAAGDLACTVPIRRRDEIADLGRSVNDMSADLREMFQQLRQEHGRLEAANAQLRELDELKTKFITIASHELRTPLTIVTSLIEVLATNRLEPARRERVLTGIRKNLDRLADLVGSITNIEFLSTASASYRRRPVDLAALVADVAGDLAAVLEERRLALALDLPQGLPPADADPARIAQVLNNLLLNAVRFTPDGGKIVVEALPPTAAQPHLTIRIRDTGIGIPEDELERIFEAFYQIASWQHHHSGTTQFGSGGLGLGLFIARRIVEDHGGSIRAESGLSRGESGSTFTLTLPVAAAPAAPS
jgi:signal transduction histidine kinase